MSTDCKISYTDVSAPTRLAYTTLADFVPGVEPYEVATLVELEATANGVKIRITFDAMHDDVWTGRARAGHESQLVETRQTHGEARWKSMTQFVSHVLPSSGENACSQ